MSDVISNKQADKNFYCSVCVGGGEADQQTNFRSLQLQK